MRTRRVRRDLRRAAVFAWSTPFDAAMSIRLYASRRRASVATASPVSGTGNGKWSFEVTVISRSPTSAFAVTTEWAAPLHRPQITTWSANHLVAWELARAQRYERELMNPDEALSLGSISQIVMPGDLRRVLGEHLAFCLRHYEPGPLQSVQREFH